jgi:integrase
MRPSDRRGNKAVGRMSPLLRSGWFSWRKRDFGRRTAFEEVGRLSIAKSASIRQAHWDCPSEETTQTRGSNLLGTVLVFRRLKLPKGASLHSLRHSHCSHLLASDVPLPAESARLGHGSIRTTKEIYSHMIHGARRRGGAEVGGVPESDDGRRATAEGARAAFH